MKTIGDYFSDKDFRYSNAMDDAHRELSDSFFAFVTEAIQRVSLPGHILRQLKVHVPEIANRKMEPEEAIRWIARTIMADVMTDLDLHLDRYAWDQLKFEVSAEADFLSTNPDPRQ